MYYPECFFVQLYSNRYRPTSLMSYGIHPGPKTSTYETLPNFMKEYIDDLIRLYDEGILIKTRKYPEGMLSYSIQM